MAVIFMGLMLAPAGYHVKGGFMKLLAILAASLALALAGCNRDQSAGSGSSAPGKSPSSAASGSSSGQTSSGGASGSASEGSTDKSAAPKRPGTSK
jgi:hypothetical protein